MVGTTWEQTFAGVRSHRVRQQQKRHSHQTVERSATQAVKEDGSSSASLELGTSLKSPFAQDEVTLNFPRQFTLLIPCALAITALHVGLAMFWQSDRMPPSPPPLAIELIQTQAVQPPAPPQPPEPIRSPNKPLSQALPAPTSAPKIAVAEQPATSSIAAPTIPSDSSNTALSPAPAATAAVHEAVETITPAVGYVGYLHNPAPTYPAAAQRLGLEGKVVLRVQVQANGQPSKVEVQTSSGRKLLDEAAIAAVQGWLFAPAKRGQIAIEGWATVPIEFKLER